MKTIESTSNLDLTISVTDSEGGAVVSVTGRVSVDSSPGLRKELLGLLSRRSLRALIIDLSQLSYIDCSGIATLIEALRIARQRQTKLELRGVRDGPRHLLEVTGLLGLFDTDGETDHSPVSKGS
ncbi:MAG: STAS domain-containing protein [Terriglobia bacterium]